jgi:hypothetical protein
MYNVGNLLNSYKLLKWDLKKYKLKLEYVFCNGEIQIKKYK